MQPPLSGPLTPHAADLANVYGRCTSFLELGAIPSAPSWARRHARAALEAWQLPAETIDSAQLVVSELVTNALNVVRPGHFGASGEFTPGSPARIAVTLRQLPGRVVIEVSDDHPDPPVIAGADVEAEYGRGLMIVAALAKEWGHFCPPSGGKTVYAVMAADE